MEIGAEISEVLSCADHAGAQGVAALKKKLGHFVLLITRHMGCDERPQWFIKQFPQFRINMVEKQYCALVMQGRIARAVGERPLNLLCVQKGEPRPKA